MTNKRTVMTRSCEPLEKRSDDLAGIAVRGLDGEDGTIIGNLLYFAYKGGVDDEGQSVEEARVEGVETLQGRYGAIIWPACFVATASANGENAVCCSVVTESERFGAFIAFVATHPDFQRRGLAGALMAKSIDALREVEVDRVTLVVTDANEHAVSLYRKLGFVAS
jgi:ribosomal protein S18 acetylase RimI-like enzyme